LDIGGVPLTNGWDQHARRRAAKAFHLDFVELEDRHHLTFDTYEMGKLALKEYLIRVVFHGKRPFTRARFRRFMFAQSTPCPEMIDLVRQLKARCRLKIAVVSNEGRELNAHRIRQFKLPAFEDCFVSSCFVYVRKAAADIFRVALDLAQAPAREDRRFPNLPQIACSDTASHHDMPRVARRLPIPRRYDATGEQRHGFHGLSCACSVEELARVAGPEAANGRVIPAHHGNGASQVAVRDGKAVDPSTDFPLTAGSEMSTVRATRNPGSPAFSPAPRKVNDKSETE
jgi:putative hydrolase of the HAD superfamily